MANARMPALRAFVVSITSALAFDSRRPLIYLEHCAESVSVRFRHRCWTPVTIGSMHTVLSGGRMLPKGDFAVVTTPSRISWLVILVLALTIGAACDGCSNGDDQQDAGTTHCIAGTFCRCTQDWNCPIGELCRDGLCSPRPPDEDVEDAGEPPDVPLETSEMPEEIDLGLDESQDGETDLEMDPEITEDPPEEDRGPTCPDDDYDYERPNDTAGRAASIEIGESHPLIICPGDEDWFVVTVPAHNDGTFAIYSRYWASLELTLFDSTGSTELAVGTNTVRSGLAATLGVFAQQDILIRVREKEGAPPLDEEQTYDLEISVERVECLDDDFDLGAGNDTRADARSIADTDYNLFFCDFEDEADWYAFTAEPGFDFEINLTFNEEVIGGALELSLYHEGDADGRPSYVGSAFGGSSAITATALEPGLWQIAVRSGSAAEGAYALSLTRAPTANCAEFETLHAAVFHEPDGSESEARGDMLEFGADGRLTEPERYESLIMCEDDVADIFAFSLSLRERVTVSIFQNDTSDPLRVQVYPDGSNPEGVVPLPLVDHGFFKKYSADRSGVHYIRIEPGPGSARNTYSLTVVHSTCDFDDLEPNDVPDDAYDFGPIGVTALSLGFCPNEDTVDWYQTSVNPYRLQRIRVDNVGENALDFTLFNAPTAPMVDWCVTSDDCCYDAESCSANLICLGTRGCAAPVIGRTRVPSGSFSQQLLETGASGGEYLLRVQLANNLAPTKYDLGWHDPDSVCPEDGFGDNHSADTAYALDLPGTYPIVGALCDPPGDVVEDDYFLVNVEADTDLTITTTYPVGDRFQIEIPCGGGELVTSRTGAMSVHVPITVDDTICFRVHGQPMSPLVSALEYSLSLSSHSAEAECVADSFEPNDSSLTPSTLNGGEPWVDGFISAGEVLTICGDDHDFFELNVLEGDSLLAHAAFGSSHDLDVGLYGPCNPGACNQLVAAVADEGGRTLTYNVEQSGAYLLEVAPRYPDTAAQYELTVGITGGCTSDALEPNDLPEEATSLVADGEHLSLCPPSEFQPDFDWFTYHLHPGDELGLRLDFARYHGDMSLALWKDGLLLATGTPDENGASLAATVTEPGDFYVEIYGTGVTNNAYVYTAETTIAPCPSDGFEPNGSVADAVNLRQGEYDSLVHCHHGEDWFRVDIPADSRLFLAVSSEPTVPGDDVIFEVYEPDTAPPDEPLHRSAAGKDVDVASLEVGAGEYLIRVYQRAGTEIGDVVSYSIDALVAPPGGCVEDWGEPNNDSAAAVRLLPNGETTAMACDGDDWYVVHLFAGQTLNVKLSSLGIDGFRPSVFFWPADLSAPLGSTGTVASYEAEVSGDIYLELRKLNSRALYTLSLSTTGLLETCEADPDEDDDDVTSARMYVSPLESQLCDAADVFEIEADLNEDVRVDVQFDPSLGVVELDMTNVGGLSLGSGEPLGTGGTRGWLTWTGIGSAFAHVLPGEPAYQGPYRFDVAFLGDCFPDGTENNDSIDDSFSLTVGTVAQNLTICHNQDIDFFDWDVLAGQRAAAQVWVNRGDIGLMLFDADHQLVMASNGSWVDEPKEAVWDFPLENTTYVAAVYTPDGSTTDYDIRLLAESDPPCTDTGDNRNYASPATVSGGSYDGLVVCAGPGDWYALEDPILANKTIRVRAIHDPTEADLDIEIYSSPDNVVAGARSLEVLEQTTYLTPIAAPYVVRIFVADGSPGTEYELLFEAF